MDPFTIEEREKIIEGFQRYAPHYVNYVICGFWTGWRPNEACALKWLREDFNQGKVLIREGRVLGLTGIPKAAGSLRDIDLLPTVQYWVKQFIQRGLAGLAEAERPGRPPALNESQLLAVGRALRGSPAVYGLGTHLWDGKSLSTFIKERFRVDLGVRQCQRLFRQLGFRLRKPRPLIAHADPKVQRLYKKTAGPRPKPRG